MEQSEKVLKAFCRNVNGDTVSLFRHEDEKGGAFVVWHYADATPQLVWYQSPGDAAAAYTRTRATWRDAGQLLEL